MSASMQEKGRMAQLVDWIDARFPMTRFMNEGLVQIGVDSEVS